MIDTEAEMVISLGYECFPTNFRFQKPVKITFPHAGILHEPNEVETILYTGHRQYHQGKMFRCLDVCKLVVLKFKLAAADVFQIHAH